MKWLALVGVLVSSSVFANNDAITWLQLETIRQQQEQLLYQQQEQQAQLKYSQQEQQLQQLYQQNQY